jgi:hypothetical protein
VDSVLERMNLQSFNVADNEKLSNDLNALWTQTEMDLDAPDVHLAALVTGEGFVIAWPDADANPAAYYNDPRLCHMQYNAENPRLKDWAAKWWKESDHRYKLNLYYPDHIEYYVTREAHKDSLPSKAEAFEPAEEPRAENPFKTNAVPVFHWRRARRKISSELGNVIPLQAALNKLLADMMVSAEFAAFRQRYVIGNMDGKGQLKNAPNQIWDLPEGSSAGEFEATELKNYLDAIDNLAGAIASITRTPRHYFFSTTGQVPSGEALISMEAPLNKKVQTYIDSFSNTWQRFGAFLLELDGKTVDPETIKPIFERPETVQPRTQAEIREINNRAGVPIVSSLRAEGKSQEEIDQVLKDRAEEQKAERAGLAKALLDARRRFDKGEAA